MAIVVGRASAIAKRQLDLRNSLWPGLDEATLWLRKKSDGFTTVPRTMPLIMMIMDHLSNRRPVSSTYFELWCRAFDECFVALSKPREMAFHAGFTGQRAEQTWATRMKILRELGFIDIKSGPSGPLSYALIWSPYLIIQRHRNAKTPGLREDAYNALAARAAEIGADDLTRLSSTSATT